MKRVFVLTSIERAFYSSTIEYQLLEPIIEVAKQSGNKFIYLGLVPITFWISRKEPYKSFRIFRENRKRIKKWLDSNHIEANFIPILFPIWHKDFYLRIHWLILYAISSFPIILCILIWKRINLIHSRNYPATLLAFFAKSVLGIPYNFDMRDLYPEKGIEAGMFGKLATRNSQLATQKSWSYRLWKSIEYKLLQEANYVITTSEPFNKYVNSKLKTQNSKLKVIPNCVNTQRFKPDKEKREEIRTKYGITNKFVLIHSGTFGTEQDIPLTFRYFSKWKKLDKSNSYGIENAHLVILCGTKEFLPKIRKILMNEGVKKEDYTLINPLPGEVPDYLLLGDVGLHLESIAIATPYGIAIKDGEYLASGLPVICTPWLRGITPFIEKYKAGIVIDPNLHSAELELYLLKNYEELRQGGLKLVNEVLSLSHCINSLSDIYK
ncbi:glycosyltransferase [candidate division WOR-3 bacterium]|nr:glycosyltransferase [candidate division WOR-3 bacterium]